MEGERGNIRLCRLPKILRTREDNIIITESRKEKQSHSWKLIKEKQTRSVMGKLEEEEAGTWQYSGGEKCFGAQLLHSPQNH